MLIDPSVQQGDGSVGLSTTSTAGIVERIRRIHGSAVANEVVEFSVSKKTLGFKAKGMLSNANYHVKKTTLLLFINGIPGSIPTPNPC